MLVAVDARFAGMLGVADPIKSSAADAIKARRADGIHVVMRTGDNGLTAKAVAHKLGIDEVIADVLPDQKADKVRALQEQGRIVAMAGDGINDAPALARGDLSGFTRARSLSRQTIRNIQQNLFFAFFYNAAGVPIAAGVLYPWLHLLLSSMLAAAAMSLSSVSVIANALRLRRARL